jgi:hypothetical protein
MDRSNRRLAARTAELAPTTRITIGRIEVKAVVAQAPRPQPGPETRRKPEPSLSLDEYLKQRDGNPK